LNYPYGIFYLECKKNNFKFSETDYSICQVKDLLHKNNKSPIFEDREEFEVYGKITPLEYIFINPTIISFIIICILVVIIILIFLFHRNIKITNFYLN